jgi:phosphoglycerate dehydrogenase-like enzyme
MVGDIVAPKERNRDVILNEKSAFFKGTPEQERFSMTYRSVFVYDSLDVDDSVLNRWELELTHGVPVHAIGIARAKMPSRDFIEKAQNHRAILGASGALITDEVMESLPELQFIAKLGIGYEVIDVDAATRRGIVVTNTPIHSEVSLVAEHTIALLLACVKQFYWYNTPYVREGGWRNGDHLVGTLEGATVGIIGFGNIGQAVGRRLIPFGAKVITHDVCEIEPFNGVSQVSLDDLLHQSDVVTLHAPPTKDGPILNEQRLASMKPGAILIITARGALVVTRALSKLLESGHLASAGIDVFSPEPPHANDPLLTGANTFLTPHVAAWNSGVRIEMVELALAGLDALFDGKVPANVVNPEVFEKGLRT